MSSGFVAALVALSGACVLLAVANVVTLRITRMRWRAKAQTWRMEEARRVVIQVEYLDGEREILAEAPAGADEDSVRAIDHAIRDLSVASHHSGHPKTV